jgi:hypothetical protein
VVEENIRKWNKGGSQLWKGDRGLNYRGPVCDQ